MNILIIAIIGGTAFFWGFKRLGRKRLIENIPTSTVRGMAMGLVELIGQVKARVGLKSPLTNTDCVFFRYTVERWRSSGRSGRWVKINEGDSFLSPFYLDDNTGRVLVDPKGAELMMPVDYEFTTGWGKDLPANLIMFMAKGNLRYSGIFGQYRVRFREWRIYPDQQVYVLGKAKKSADFVGGHKETVLERLRDLKKDTAGMAEVDANKDNQISPEEWEAIRQKIEQEVLEQT
ncbi:MAG: GIDE domain-containing protein, partial [bacterium]